MGGYKVTGLPVPAAASDAATKNYADSKSIPSGAVMFFNLASCPSGWTELTSARGRYVVGLPASGTLVGTTGTALSNNENRPVGQHTHGITDPGHRHEYGGFGVPNYYSQTVVATAGSGMSSTTSTTGITINNAGSVAGTNAPYIQLLVCQKS